MQNSLNSKKEIEKNFLNNIFRACFVLYIVFIYCFNDNKEYYRLISIAFICLMGIPVLRLLTNLRNVSIFENKASIILVLYALYGSISSVWSINQSLAEEKANTIIQLVIFAIIVIYYFTKTGSVKLIPFAMSVAGVILSIYTIQTYGGIFKYLELASLEGERVGEDVGQLNVLGMNCSYTVVLLFYYALYYKKLILYPVIILPFIVAIGSGSRKTIITIVVGILLLLLLSQIGKKNRAVNILKTIFLLIIAVFIFTQVLKLPIMVTVNERMDGLFETLKGNEGDSSSIVRYRMIECGWKQFLKQPVWGIGLDNARIINLKYVGRLTYLHNDYIEQLVNGGIIGFGLFYGLIVYLIIRHIKLLKYGEECAVISFVFLMIFISNAIGTVQYYNKITYIFLSLWISVVNTYDNRMQKENAKGDFKL